MQSPQLTDQTTRHAVYLERLKGGEVKKFTDFLREMDASITRRLSNKELTEYTRGRLERLLRATREDLREILGDYQAQLELSLINVGEYEAEFEAKSLSQLGVETVIPAASQVRAAIFTQPLHVTGTDGGKLLESFISDWADSDADFVANKIRQGAYEGQTNHQIRQAIRGTVAANFKDGSLAVVNRHAEAITRTSVQHVASTARMETWQDNSDIVTGYRWLSTLDSRTSPTCRSLDQQVFKFGEGPLPPAHVNCRSTTMAELDGRYSYLNEGGTRAARSTKTGKTVDVPASETYYSWLKRQPVAFQNDAIGPTRAKLLRDGGLTADRFAKLQLDKNFTPIDLNRMRELEPVAFERAGL